MYQQGKTLEEIGKFFGISRQRVQHILIEVGCERRSYTKNPEKIRKNKKRLVLLPEAVMRELFVEKDLSIPEISKKLEIEQHNVKRSLDYHGIRYRTERQTLTLIQQSNKITRDELYYYFTILKQSAVEIAERLDVYPKFDKADFEIR